EPLVDNHQSYRVNVKNGDGHLSSAAVQLNVFGIVDLLDNSETLSQEERVNLAHRAGLKVVPDANCPGVLWFLDPETNKTLNPPFMVAFPFRDHERITLPPDGR